MARSPGSWELQGQPSDTQEPTAAAPLSKEKAATADGFCRVYEEFWEGVPESANPPEVAAELERLVVAAPPAIRGDMELIQQTISKLTDIEELDDPGSPAEASLERYDDFVDRECYGEPDFTPGLSESENERAFFISVRRDERLGSMTDSDLLQLGYDMCDMSLKEVARAAATVADKDPDLMMSLLHVSNSSNDYLCRGD